MWWQRLQTQAETLADDLSFSHRALNIASPALVHPTAILDTSVGPISIGLHTRICAGAYIQGPTVIGENCLIGNNSMIRGCTTIRNHVQVGFSVEIKNAILEDRVSIGPMSYVADSVLLTEVFLGAMVRTSNYRLDGEDVSVMHEGERVSTKLKKLGCEIGARSSLGIQCIILPGRVVAPDSMFAPRITIEKNLPSGNYRIKQDLVSF